MALTIIDQVTNVTELVRVDNKTAEHAARNFALTRLSRCPWPENCIHDNGREFTGWEFQKLLSNKKLMILLLQVVILQAMSCVNTCIKQLEMYWYYEL